MILFYLSTRKHLTFGTMNAHERSFAFIITEIKASYELKKRASKRRALKKSLDMWESLETKFRFQTLFFSDAVDFHSGGRVSRARLQPSPSLRSVRVLPLVLFPQKSPPPINQLELPLSLEGLSSPTTSQISYIIKHDEQAAFQETDTFKNRYKSKKIVNWKIRMA